jgi:EmrB/QacA subfamily drug resistance transporter
MASFFSGSHQAVRSSQRMVAAALMLGMFVSGLDTSIVNIILPTLQSVFGVQADQAMMLATIYLAMLAGLQLVFGRCADIFESGAVFSGGLLLFILGSLGCALSATFPHILSCRAIQGVGGAMMAASFGALILSDFSRDKTGSVLGAVVTAIGLGTIVGPPLGGVLAEHLSWRWAFLINIPICALAFVILFFHLRAKPPSGVSLRERFRQLDGLGSLLSILMFTSLPIGIGSLAGHGGLSQRVALLLGLFAISLVLFIGVEKRARNPLLQLSLFRNRHFNRLVLIKMMLLMVLNGLLLVFPFFLTRGMGLSPADTGLLMLANAMAMAVTTPLAGRITDQRGGNGVMAGSSALLLAVSLGALLLPGRPSTVQMVGVLVLFGVALAAVLISSTTLLLKSAPQGQEGVFSGINALSMAVGGSLGLAVFSYLYARGAMVGQGPQAAHGGFISALSGVTVGSGILLLLVLVHMASARLHNGSTAMAGRW